MITKEESGGETTISCCSAIREEQIKGYTCDSRITQTFRDGSVGETVRLLHVAAQSLGEFYSIFGAGAG